MAEQQPAQRLHPASLIPVSEHNPLLLGLLGRRVSLDMVEHVARQAARVIRIDGEDETLPEGKSLTTIPLPTPPATPIKVKFADVDAKETKEAEMSPELEDPSLIPLDKFILHLVRCSNVQVATLLTTLVYLERLRSKLPTMAKGDYRHFLLLSLTWNLKQVYHVRAIGSFSPRSL